MKLWLVLYTEEEINEVSLTLSVLHWENRLMKSKTFHGAIQPNNKIFTGFNHMEFCLSGDACFNCFVLQNREDILT